MIWRKRAWVDLTRDELHGLLRLRTDIFVVEQNCPYPELDGKDLHSVHVYGVKDEASLVSGDAVLACARIVDSSPAALSIGRVAVAEGLRGRGLGQALMMHCFDVVAERHGRVTIRISAQSHLQDFYAELGFVARGEEYLEDDIPHREMWRAADPVEAWSAAFAHGRQALRALPDVPDNPELGIWGTAATVGHLAMVVSAVAGAFEGWKAESSRPLTDGHRAASVMLVQALSGKGRFVVPEGLELPALGGSTEAAWEALEAAETRCLEAARSMPAEAWGRTVFRHGVAGWLGVDGGLAFLQFHHLHHRRILRHRAAGKL
jgi:ElaA protein